MSGYILYVDGAGYLRDPDPDEESFTQEPAQAYVFFYRDEVEEAAENWRGAVVIPMEEQ
jgi:hypothetical protein